MLKDEDYGEAVARYKDMKGNSHERQRYHALILVTCGYSYRETAAILLVDEETVSRWVGQYEKDGLEGLKNDPEWGGEHGQRELDEQQLTELKERLTTTAMVGTAVGSGWTVQAVGALIREQFKVDYSEGGVRKILYHIGWSYQRGRKLYIQRTEVEQARYELETREALQGVAERGVRVAPSAGDQTKVYLEATIACRWNPKRQQPLIPDGSRSKRSENIYSALHLGTGTEVCPFVIDWQDSAATIRWLEMIVEAHPGELVLLWIDRGPHHTSEEVEEWLEEHHRQIQVIHFQRSHRHGGAVVRDRNQLIQVDVGRGHPAWRSREIRLPAAGLILFHRRHFEPRLGAERDRLSTDDHSKNRCEEPSAHSPERTAVY